MHAFSRTEMLIGKEGLARLRKSKVAVFGIGGVGSYAVEALARSGVGSFVLVDGDDIALTNLNRQIHATTKTIGLPKVQVMRERILEINPLAGVETHRVMYGPANGAELISTSYSYVVDAVDMVAAKLDLVERCTAAGIPVISSMGAGNKLDPVQFEVADIYNTRVCPLARVMRHELRKRGIKALKVVYSQEPSVGRFPQENDFTDDDGAQSSRDIARAKRGSIPGSVAFVPPVAGLLLAAEVVKDLIARD